MQASLSWHHSISKKLCFNLASHKVSSRIGCTKPNSHFDLFDFGYNGIKLAKTSNEQNPGDELAIVSSPLISSSILANCGSPRPKDQIKCLIGKILNKSILGSLNLFVNCSNNYVVYMSLKPWYFSTTIS